MAIEKAASRIARLEAAMLKVQRKLGDAKKAGDDTRVAAYSQRLSEYKQSLSQLKAGKREFDIPSHASLPVGVAIRAVKG